MIGPTHVNCRRHRHSQEAKDADWLQPKGVQPVAPPRSWGTRTQRLPVYEAGTTSFVSFKRNKVSPLPCLSGQALPQGTPLRQRVEETGESECRSVMGRTGVETSLHCESRQTSSMVVVDGRTYRIFEGGNCK